MKILFYDPVTPFAYDAATPFTQALGGTEATVIRITEALKKYHQVYVAQHCRKMSNPQTPHEVNYLSFEMAQQLAPDIVILLRQYRKLEEVATHFPKARRYLWLHNMPSRDLYQAQATLKKYNYQIIAVSQFHRHAIERRLRGKWYQNLFSRPCTPLDLPIHVLYNPIDDFLHPNHTPIQAQQLLFMSSPQKGLFETLKLFEAVRCEFPEYELLIANPGYTHMSLTLPKQARFLGALSHPKMIEQLRSVFCVFYPQYKRVETFGLVYAEANAVGTPVLAHDAGAAREVLSNSCQLVNGQKLSSILDKLNEWRTQRPRLQGKNEFRLAEITKNWLALLD